MGPQGRLDFQMIVGLTFQPPAPLPHLDRELPGLFVVRTPWRVCQPPTQARSPAEDQEHLQVASFVNLHHGRPQLPPVSTWQEASALRGDSQNIPEP